MAGRAGGGPWRSEVTVMSHSDAHFNAAEVHGMLTGILLAEPDGVQVTVRDGGVILSGSLARPNLIPVAERLAAGVDGVVTVICKLTIRAGSGAASAR
jgi:osmotically-inducible protein OsmY